MYRVCVTDQNEPHGYKELGSAEDMPSAMGVMRDAMKKGYRGVSMLDEDWSPVGATSCVSAPMPR